MSKSILIVGTGGTGSYLIPLLLKHLTSNDEIILVDGDKLEKHNLNRQLFSPRMVGQFKVDALSTTYSRPGAPKITTVSEYLTNVRAAADQYGDHLSAIIACPDNHNARRLCLELADNVGVPAVLCGNEVESAEAMLYLPTSKQTAADPRVAYPEINLNDERDPTHACTGVAQEENKQLALANFIAAGFGMSYLFKTVIEPVENPELLPFELNWTPYGASTGPMIESMLKPLTQEN